jgi:hypothetical protein
MDRTQLAAEALIDALAQYGDAEAIEERIAVIEREAAARVQAAEAKATQALAENDQRLAAIKGEMAVAEAAREEALAEAAAARDANAQLEDEVVPRLETAVAGLEERLESERAAHAQALADQAANAAAELEAVHAKADARVAAADEQAKQAKEAARTAEEIATQAKAATQAAEAVAAEQRTELARLREAHTAELARVREEHAAELAKVRAEADARVTETREELARLADAHTAELSRVQQQGDARLAERVDSLTAAHSAQLEARDARIAAAEQLATERAAERDRLEAEIALLGEQIRALNAAAQRQAGDAEAEAQPPPSRPSRRRAQRPAGAE